MLPSSQNHLSREKGPRGASLISAIQFRYVAEFASAALETIPDAITMSVVSEMKILRTILSLNRCMGISLTRRGGASAMGSLSIVLMNGLLIVQKEGTKKRARSPVFLECDLARGHLLVEIMRRWGLPSLRAPQDRGARFRLAYAAVRVETPCVFPVEISRNWRFSGLIVYGHTSDACSPESRV